MKSKQDVRKHLNDSVMVFLANGGTITKVKEKSHKKSKEEVVEIEVSFLPPELQKKYFSES